MSGSASNSAAGRCSTSRPDSSAMASSEILRALFTFCSTISTVVPWSASLRSSLNTSCTTMGDRPMEGSSISNTRGRSSRARPISSCFCSPPESEEAMECSRSLTRGKNSSTSGIRSWVVFMPRVIPPSSRFCHTLSWPNRLRPWGTKAMPRASSSLGEMPLISSPSSSTLPWRGLSRPNRVLSTVDLPAPLGPSSSVMAPDLALRLRLFRIMKSL